MGLDIYAGTLTRYYSHNWKTVVQQWAEENGYSFNRITPDGEPADNEEEMSPAEVQAAVENWRDQILSAISQPGQPPYAPWLEDNEKPYYTDKPDWDAFGAMLLVAACRTYEEPVPSTVEKDWIFGEHPLVARLASDEERVWSLFRGATWLLPLSDSFSSSFRSPPKVAIATVSSVGRGPWNRKLSVRGSHQVTPRNRDHTRSSSDARRAIKGCSPKIQSFSTVGGTGSSYVRQAATSSIAPKASQSGLSV